MTSAPRGKEFDATPVAEGEEEDNEPFEIQTRNAAKTQAYKG